MLLRPSQRPSQRASLAKAQQKLSHLNQPPATLPGETIRLCDLLPRKARMARWVARATNPDQELCLIDQCITCRPAQTSPFLVTSRSATSTIKPGGRIVGSLEIPVILVRAILAIHGSRVKSEIVASLENIATLVLAGIRIWSGVKGRRETVKTTLAEGPHPETPTGLSYCRAMATRRRNFNGMGEDEDLNLRRSSPRLNSPPPRLIPS